MIVKNGVLFEFDASPSICQNILVIVYSLQKMPVVYKQMHKGMCLSSRFSPKQKP